MTTVELAAIKGIQETLHDFVHVVGKRFDSVDARFEKMGVRLTGVEGELGEVKSRLMGLEQGMSDVRTKLKDLSEEIQAGLAATDRDALLLIEHEKRITRLERKSTGTGS